MALQLDDYLPALDDAPPGLGRPLLLAIALIDEDPAQPRLDFDDDALAELARTIGGNAGCDNPSPFGLIRRSPIAGC
jgi:hypothetical protein